MRVRTCKESEKKNFIESRLSGSACNIYLGIAGMIAAGIDGIKNKLDPGEPGLGPSNETVPQSLSEALDALKKDKVLTDSLGATFIDWFIKVIPMFTTLDSLHTSLDKARD